MREFFLLLCLLHFFSRPILPSLSRFLLLAAALCELALAFFPQSDGWMFSAPLFVSWKFIELLPRWIIWQRQRQRKQHQCVQKAKLNLQFFPATAKKKRGKFELWKSSSTSFFPFFSPLNLSMVWNFHVTFCLLSNRYTMEHKGWQEQNLQLIREHFRFWGKYYFIWEMA